MRARSTTTYAGLCFVFRVAVLGCGAGVVKRRQRKFHAVPSAATSESDSIQLSVVDRVVRLLKAQGQAGRAAELSAKKAALTTPFEVAMSPIACIVRNCPEASGHRVFLLQPPSYHPDVRPSVEYLFAASSSTSSEGASQPQTLPSSIEESERVRKYRNIQSSLDGALVIYGCYGDGTGVISDEDAHENRRSLEDAKAAVARCEEAGVRVMLIKVTMTSSHGDVAGGGGSHARETVVAADRVVDSSSGTSVGMEENASSGLQRDIDVLFGAVANRFREQEQAIVIAEGETHSGGAADSDDFDDELRVWGLQRAGDLQDQFEAFVAALHDHRDAERDRSMLKAEVEDAAKASQSVADATMLGVPLPPAPPGSVFLLEHYRPPSLLSSATSPAAAIADPPHMYIALAGLPGVGKSSVLCAVLDHFVVQEHEPTRRLESGSFCIAFPAASLDPHSHPTAAPTGDACCDPASTTFVNVTFLDGPLGQLKQQLAGAIILGDVSQPDYSDTALYTADSFRDVPNRLFIAVKCDFLGEEDWGDAGASQRDAPHQAAPTSGEPLVDDGVAVTVDRLVALTGAMSQAASSSFSAAPGKNNAPPSDRVASTRPPQVFVAASDARGYRLRSNSKLRAIEPRPTVPVAVSAAAARRGMWASSSMTPLHAMIASFVHQMVCRNQKVAFHVAQQLALYNERCAAAPDRDVPTDEASLRRLFHRIDTSGDGRISVAEAAAMFEEFNTCGFGDAFVALRDAHYEFGHREPAPYLTFDDFALLMCRLAKR